MLIKSLKRIQKQDDSFNRMSIALNQLEGILQNLELLQTDFKELMDYYGSEQWHEDVVLSESPEFTNTPCGVLSQDAVYNFYQKQKQLHFKSIRLSLNYLEV